jgi:hypothetical protein
VRSSRFTLISTPVVIDDKDDIWIDKSDVLGLSANAALAMD